MTKIFNFNSIEDCGLPDGDGKEYINCFVLVGGETLYDASYIVSKKCFYSQKYKRFLKGVTHYSIESECDITDEVVNKLKEADRQMDYGFMYSPSDEGGDGYNSFCDARHYIRSVIDSLE